MTSSDKVEGYPLELIKINCFENIYKNMFGKKHFCYASVQIIQGLLLSTEKTNYSWSTSGGVYLYSFLATVSNGIIGEY